MVFLSKQDSKLLQGQYSSVEKRMCYRLIKKEARGLKLVEEYRFHPSRLWRFDLAVPSRKIAFKYEGIFRGNTRHVRNTGYSKDCEKYNHAALLGWRVYRFTAFDFGSQGKIEKTVGFLKKVFGD